VSEAILSYIVRPGPTKKKKKIQVVLFFFLGGAGVRIQDLTLAKQALYHLYHSADPVFCVGYFPR
jgi:hypothetical protein